MDKWPRLSCLPPSPSCWQDASCCLLKVLMLWCFLRIWDHVFVFPQNSYLEVLTLNRMVKRWRLGSYIRSWGWGTHDGISALTEETAELSRVSYIKKPGREFSPGLNHADILFLNFQPLDQSGKNKRLLLTPCLCCSCYSSPNQWDTSLFSGRLPRWLSSKESACQCRRHGFDPWVRKIPWRRKWQLTPVFPPGKSHGQKSLVGCSPGTVGHDLATEHRHTYSVASSASSLVFLGKHLKRSLASLRMWSRGLACGAGALQTGAWSEVTGHLAWLSSKSQRCWLFTLHWEQTGEMRSVSAL